MAIRPYFDQKLAEITRYFDQKLAIIRKKGLPTLVMERNIARHLLQWKEKSPHYPLLLRGARQVGKTHAVISFGKQHFEDLVNINFELQPEFMHCFEQLDPARIIQSLQVLLRKEIQPGKTLLFLDEIQQCPNAIKSLRYFKELLPELHVIGAGSLLEFAMEDAGMSMPVGRVHYLFMGPMSFEEFLLAREETHFLEFIQNIKPGDAINDAIHQKGMSLVADYMNIGGMPAVVDEFVKTQDISFCQQIQSSIILTYQSDFAKYARTTQHKYLQKTLEQAPRLIGQTTKYAKIDPDVKSRDIKAAIQMLEQAGIVQMIRASKGKMLPLGDSLIDKRFKLAFLDIGLAKRLLNLDLAAMLAFNQLLSNQGQLCEQFVAQNLLSNQSPYHNKALYFWHKGGGSTAELDFLVPHGQHIVPLEVKAGKSHRTRSLNLFIDEHDCLGVRISADKLTLAGKTLTLPLYMVGQLMRLLDTVL